MKIPFTPFYLPFTEILLVVMIPLAFLPAGDIMAKSIMVSYEWLTNNQPSEEESYFPGDSEDD